MTEPEWLSDTHPFAAFLFLHKRPETTDRKCRLSAVAFCRRVADWLSARELDGVIDLCEEYADGEDPMRLLFAQEIARRNPYHWERTTSSGCGESELRDFVLAVCTLTAFSVSAEDCAEWCRDAVCGHDDFVTGRGEMLFQQDLIRDIFGNPFRPVEFAPGWRTSTAVGLANAMYTSRDFAGIPILADALEEAGCDHPDVLAHCRGDGPHVRGCWVVDLVLGKA